MRLKRHTIIAIACLLLAIAGGVWLYVASRPQQSAGTSTREPSGTMASGSASQASGSSSNGSPGSQTTGSSTGTIPTSIATFRPLETTRPEGLIELRSIEDSDRPDARSIGIRVTKSVNGQVVWSYEDDTWTDYFYDAQAIETTAGVYVFGTLIRTEWDAQSQGANLYSGRVVFLSPEGKFLWRQVEVNGQDGLSFDQAIAEADGLVIFGSTQRGDQRLVTVWKYAESGKLLWRKENPVSQSSEVKQALPFADRYLVRLGFDSNSQLVSIDRTGTLIGVQDLTVSGRSFFIVDILPVGDRAYLSCMARNIDRNDLERRLGQEFERIRQDKAGEPSEREEWVIPEPYQTELFKFFESEYTAALLVLDQRGIVSLTNVIENVRAGELALADSLLTQRIFRIESIRRAPLLMSAARMFLNGTESQARFDANGQHLSLKATKPYRTYW